MAPSAFTPLYGTVRHTHRPPRTDGGRLWRAKLWIVVVMVSILNAVFAPANTAAAASAPRRQGGRRAVLCASNEPSAARAKRVAIARPSKLKQETSHCLLRNGKDH